jgi:glucose-6-phosphate 1-dehydrogenase
MSANVEANPIEGLTPAGLPQGDSCLLIIFGASGDLARRKLIPSLYNLACVGCMNPKFEILGTGRTPMSDEQFRAKMREAASQASDTHDFSDTVWGEFANRLHYFPGDLNDAQFYDKLRDRLNEMRKSGSSGNHLFYLSTPASEAPRIIEGLGASSLNHSDGCWVRVIIEKPFGRDLESARRLNEIVLKVFDEQNVYRIDHYLGKETVQNILVFRFGNSLYEPVWNRNYVDHVEITGAETVGLEGRASFYEETGALRDMVANHLLQLLALTAMEPPVAFDADSIRQQKVQVLRSIRPMTVEEVAQRTLRGQYGPGQVDGKAVPGYRQEPGVKPDSTTETFVALKLFIDNWRWADVPFHIRTGKRQSHPMTEIRVHMRRTPQALFATTPKDQRERNIITLRIQPNEGISIAFGAKRPGNQMRTVTVQADFSYRAMFGGNAPVAYETLLLDAMLGDPTLFTSKDEVEAEWRIITPIEEAWTKLPPPNFPNYPAGSDGPAIPATLF